MLYLYLSTGKLVNFKSKNEFLFVKEANVVMFLTMFISEILECRIVYHFWEYLLNREIPVVVCERHGFTFQQRVLKLVANTLFNKIKPYSHIHCFWFITIISDLEYPSLGMLFYALWFRVPFYSMLWYFRRRQPQFLTLP